MINVIKLREVSRILPLPFGHPPPGGGLLRPPLRGGRRFSAGGSKATDMS